MSPRSRDLPRRSCHAVPGSSPRYIAKGRNLAADMVFLDLEDAVAPAEKEAARATVADAVAASQIYGPPLIVVDLGTGTVFDAIDANGDYVGGAIAPGIGIASEALFSRAAKLYRVELSRPRTSIGRKTVNGIQSGIVFGYVGLIEGIVGRMKKEIGENARVIGTGGFADLIAKETDVIDVVNQDLTLEGLRMIYDMNRS